MYVYIYIYIRGREALGRSAGGSNDNNKSNHSPHS